MAKAMITSNSISIMRAPSTPRMLGPGRCYERHFIARENPEAADRVHSNHGSLLLPFRVKRATG
jgi:hypothetical protein